MNKILDWIRMRWLIVKRKILNIFETKPMQWLIAYDITFIFLFLALSLIGYAWNWKVLLGAFGSWILFKEVIKQLRMVAKDLSRK